MPKAIPRQVEAVPSLFLLSDRMGAGGSTLLTGLNEGAFVRAGYHCSGLILQDQPVDATVDNAGMNAGLMVAIVLPRYLPQASNNRAIFRTPLRWATLPIFGHYANPSDRYSPIQVAV